MVATIAHLIDTGGPGGAETVFSTLVGRLDSDRWTSIPIIPREGWLSENLRAIGNEPLIQPAERSFDIGYLARLVRLFRRLDVDLVQTHLLGSAVYGSLAARLCGLPVVATFHGLVDVSNVNRLRRLKLQFLNRTVTRTVFVSHTLNKEFAARTNIHFETGVIIPNGVEVDRYMPEQGESFIRQEFGIASDDVLVGALGNIRPAKNYHLLLRAAALLKEDSVSYHFLIVGEGHGRLLEQLLDLRAELGLEETVTFAGFRDDVERVLSGLDLYLLTSSSEGFSLSTVQALASGLPVVATRCGGPEEIITHGKHGLLVDASSPKEVAEGVRHLARNPSEAQRLAMIGQRLVRERFSVDAMVHRYEALYEDCLAQ